MSIISPTLLIFLFLIFGAGPMVVANKDTIPKRPCLVTALSTCGTSCDQPCCKQKCIDKFQEKYSDSICQFLSGSKARLCNCYHDC
ncbi:hypothetical protein P3S67_030107 [Capsicum chacoense]